MDAALGTTPWYRRWWGVLAIAYVVITGALGVWFLIVRRTAHAPTAISERAGGITEAFGPATTPSGGVVPLFSDDDPSIGSPDAAITVVEFSDFECPYCRQFFPTLREATTVYGDRVRFVYRDFPVTDAHPNAQRAAEAGQCAHVQGKFWAYHDKLFQNAEALDDASLLRYARAVGLDTAAFDACMRSHVTAARVDADRDAGQELGVRGTPTFFFVSRAAPDHARKVEGVIPREQFFTALDRVLTSVSAAARY